MNTNEYENLFEKINSMKKRSEFGEVDNFILFTIQELNNVNAALDEMKRIDNSRLDGYLADLEGMREKYVEFCKEKNPRSFNNYRIDERMDKINIMLGTNE